MYLLDGICNQQVCIVYIYKVLIYICVRVYIVDIK